MRLPLATSLVALVAVFFVVLVQNGRLPKPSKASRIAYTRLQEIAKEPHPYNSRRNDEVLDYLRHIISRDCPSAIDDSDNSTTWISHGDNRDVKVSTYFEQRNLVIYLPSNRDKVNESILLSAHYDSVSSGNGATDDGVGITVLLALIQKYCKHSLPANLVFNINDAEEDGLFGAQAFLRHDRMKNVKAFVNLEGAGAGGKAVLFRVSNAEVAKAYRGSKLPLASIAGNDFFRQRFIRSETDFVVYDPVVPGLDIAFFAPRSLYHTRRDSTKTTSAYSIEHMLSAAEQTMLNLSGQPKGTHSSRPFYFDFLGLFFFSTTLTKLLVLDLILLLAAPVLLGASFAVRSYVARIKIVGLGRTFGALIVQASMVAGLAILINLCNPYIVYSSPLLVSATLLLGSFTASMVATRIFISRIRDQHDLSRVMSWELCIIWYVLLFISTVISLVKGLGSTYVITLNFIASLAVALVSLFERSAYVPPREHFESSHFAEDDRQSHESSPLLRREPLAPEIEESILRDKRSRDYRSGTTWIVKYLIFVPLPALVALWLLFSNVLPGLSQTLSDPSSPGIVYAIVSVFAVLTFFNLAPFFLSTSLSTALPAFLLLLCILSATTVLKAPFDVKAPLKLYFRQFVDLDAKTSEVVIEGVPGFLSQAVGQLALAQEGLNCTRDASKRGLDSCNFKTSIDKRLLRAGITSHVKEDNRTGQLRLTVDTTNSRICDLQFESALQICKINDHKVHARESHLRLYRRDWNKPFEIIFDEDAAGTSGRITCFLDDRREGQIEAFETVQRELPEWAEVVKRDTGLIWFSQGIKLK